MTFKVSRMSLEIATHASSLQLVAELVSFQMQAGEGEGEGEAHTRPRWCIYYHPAPVFIKEEEEKISGMSGNKTVLRLYLSPLRDAPGASPSITGRTGRGWLLLAAEQERQIRFIIPLVIAVLTQRCWH